MEHALLVLLGIREISRQIKELRIPGHVQNAAPGVVRSNYLNVLFGTGVVFIGLSGYWPSLGSAGWFAAGIAPLVGTQVPCGYQSVNQDFLRWWIRQVLFAALGIACIARALGWNVL